MSPNPRLSPTYFFLKYTDYCNSHCITCQLWQAPPLTLSVETVRRIGRHLDPKNALEVYFTGGEPLLPDNAVEVAIAVNDWKPGIAITGATNALRPDLYLPKVKAMKDAGLWVNFMPSLNGLPEYHDFTRGSPGNYAKAIEMIEGLKELGALISINLLEMPSHKDYIGTTDADREHVQAIARRYGTEMWRSNITRNNPWFGVADDGATIPRFHCHAGDEVICIHPNGDITACQEPRPELVFGNLKDDCLNPDVIQRIQRDIKAGACQPCGCCTAAFTRGIRCATSR
jgi:MoaA/NifB/PqqE/SkfB family radical SAM enzyme